jgi:hypothetical protein
MIRRFQCTARRLSKSYAQLASSPRLATLAATGLVVIIGTLLRLHNLGIDSLWLDEAGSWSQSKDSLWDATWLPTC